MNAPLNNPEPRLTSLAHGGGCGCKIAPNVLRALLEGTPAASHADLIVDAGGSDDAAVWRVNDETTLVATTDFFMPIVDDPYDFGRIAATNALSDVFAMGATPIFSLAIVGMPLEKMSQGTIREILRGGREASEAAGAPVAGGHSIDSAEPIYGLVALGVGHPDRILKNGGAKPGDILILGKPLGIGIFSAAMKKNALTGDDYAAMVASTTLLNRPGADLSRMVGVHAMTDVTGFGLLGHLTEVCNASGVSALVEREKVPVFDGARRLMGEGFKTGASGRNWASVEAQIDTPLDWADADRDLLCDPQTSGGLLVACDPSVADSVLSVFAKHGHGGASIVGGIEAGGPRIEVA